MATLDPAAPRRGRILLVEDDPAVRRSLQLLLAGHGYEVRAYPGAEGLAADPEALRAECLVADLVIPGVDGVALLQALRRAGWGGKAVLISGNLTRASIERAAAEGFDAILAKPFADSALLNSLGALLPAPAG